MERRTIVIITGHNFNNDIELKKIKKLMAEDKQFSVIQDRYGRLVYESDDKQLEYLACTVSSLINWRMEGMQIDEAQISANGMIELMNLNADELISVFKYLANLQITKRVFKSDYLLSDDEKQLVREGKSIKKSWLRKLFNR